MENKDVLYVGSEITNVSAATEDKQTNEHGWKHNLAPPKHGRG